MKSAVQYELYSACMPHYNAGVMTMILPPAHNPSALLDTFSFLLIAGLVMIPLTYTCICLAGFVLGRLGSGCSLLRAGLSALFCTLLVFFLLVPTAIGLMFCAGDVSPMEQPDWLVYGKLALLLLAICTPLAVGRLFAKLSWLRTVLITLGITFSTAVIWALMFASGVFLVIMSQV